MSDSNLKDRLDKIAINITSVAAEKVGDGWALQKELMWRSGIEVLKDYPQLLKTDELIESVAPPPMGSGGQVSYREVERESGRKRETIKKWIDLVKLIGTKESQFLEWVQPEKEKAAERWRQGQLDNIQRQQIAIDTEQPPLPDKKYQVIYADPPWKYDADFMKVCGHAGTHYKPMEIEQICNLPIDSIIDENCVLFIWTTSPKLEDVYRVIEAWGFDYKTSFVWDKVKHNMGHYNSVRHEFLLIAGKGKSTPEKKILFDSVYVEERTEHSEKPEYFRTVIDKLYPSAHKIELFARKTNAPGWDFWGAEA